MEEKFMTLHPKGKKGTNILKQKYDIIKKTCWILSQRREILHMKIYLIE